MKCKQMVCLNVLLSMLLSMLYLSLTSCGTMSTQLKVQTVMVFPAESLHKELNATAITAQSEIAKQIEEEDFTVLLPTAEDYAKITSEALVVAGSFYDPNVGKYMPLNRPMYLKAVIDLASEKYPHKLLIIPELTLRTATVNGDTAEWDSVKREVTFSTPPLKTYHLPNRARGLSLNLTSYTSKGAEVCNGIGGISLPYDLEFKTKEPTLVLKTVFFTEKELKEGVKLALESFFTNVALEEK